MSSASLDDGASGSLRRKRVRSKYTARACVTCRRSKLKCTGENPCHRCRNNGRRCFYSEDQTAAEALQNLSRPAPAQTPLNNGNGIENGSSSNTCRRSILSPRDLSQRGPSDATASHRSMEARMARIEAMMEALVQERGIAFTPRTSIEREPSPQDGYHHDIDAFAANLVPVSNQADFAHDHAESRPQHTIPGHTTPSAHSSTTIHIEERNMYLQFPNPAGYQQYLEYFFAEVNPWHPCVIEDDFRKRSEEMMLLPSVPITEINFVALNYLIFACVDILTGRTFPEENSKPPGWHWYQTAQGLVGERKLSGSGDLSLIQVVILEAVYFIYADKPNSAYNVIGLACRLCFQFGINIPGKLYTLTPTEQHTRRCILWALYYTDRQIALSCWRPFGIRDVDVHMHDLRLYDNELVEHLQSFGPGMPRPLAQVFSFMLSWARFAGQIWDLTREDRPAKATELDTHIDRYMQDNLQLVPQAPAIRPLYSHFQIQHTLIYVRFNNLRLFVRRKSWMPSGFNEADNGDIAVDTVSRISSIVHEARVSESESSRIQMAASLSWPIITLARILLPDLYHGEELDPRAPYYAVGFKTAVPILLELANYSPLARRLANDLQGLVNRVTDVLDGTIPRNSQVPSDDYTLFPTHFAKQWDDWADEAPGPERMFGVAWF